MKNNIKWVFFGTSDFAAIILEELKKSEIVPNLIVTTPDRPKGRKMELMPSPVKVWALRHSIPVFQPEKLKDSDVVTTLTDYDLFIVAAYGKIIPRVILDLPKNGAFNIHPSLLPKYRGPSPLQYQILNDECELGTTIIKMDEEVDHGPIVTQSKIMVPSWPISFKTLERLTAIMSAQTLRALLEEFGRANVVAPVPRFPSTTPQNHSLASFTKMIEKADGEIFLDDDGYKNYLKYLAFEEWPGTYFFQRKPGKEVRLKIIDAEYRDHLFKPKKVIPEGKKEMSYEEFLNGF